MTAGAATPNDGCPVFAQRRSPPLSSCPQPQHPPSPRRIPGVCSATALRSAQNDGWGGPSERWLLVVAQRRSPRLSSCAQSQDPPSPRRIPGVGSATALRSAQNDRERVVSVACVG